MTGKEKMTVLCVVAWTSCLSILFIAMAISDIYGCVT